MTTFNPSDVTFAGTITEFIDSFNADLVAASCYHPPFTYKFGNPENPTIVDLPNGLLGILSINFNNVTADIDLFDPSTGENLNTTLRGPLEFELTGLSDPSISYTTACLKNCGISIIGGGWDGFVAWWANDNDDEDSRNIVTIREGLATGTNIFDWVGARVGGADPIAISPKDVSTLSKTPSPYLIVSAKAGANAKLAVVRLNIDPSTTPNADGIVTIWEKEYDSGSYAAWSNDPDVSISGEQLPVAAGITGMNSSSVALMGIWDASASIHPVITSPRLATFATFGGGGLTPGQITYSHATSSASAHGSAVNQFWTSLVCGTGGLLAGSNNHLIETYHAWDYSAPVWAKEHNSDATATFTVTTISTGTSSEGAHVHYLKNDSAPWPLPSDIVSIEINSVTYASGTIGSLANHEFAVGDIDSIGYSTLYFRRDESDGITGGIILTYGDGKGLGGGYTTSAETHIYNPIPTGKSWLVLDHDADETRVFEYDYDGNFIRRFQLSDTAMPSPTTFNGTVGVNYNTYGTTEGAGEYIVGLLPGPTDPGWAKPTSVTINGVTATEGTRGSLTDHQWCYYPATGDLPTGPPQNGWTSIIIRNTAVTSPGPIVVTIPNAEFSRWRGGNRGVQYWGTAY